MKSFDRIKSDFQDKKVLIFGLGLLGGGVGATKFFADIGARVRVTDSKPAAALEPSLNQLKQYTIDYSLGGHDPADIEWAEAIILNPAVPVEHPSIQQAQEKNIPVYNDAALFVHYTYGNVIGITGTRGKTTTAQMIHHILKHVLAEPVHLGGNATHASSLEFLKKDTEDTTYVLELSSWQLNGFHRQKLSPHIAVVTNIYPDHLNRYESMDAYVQDKHAICQYQSSAGHCIYNNSQDYTRGFAEITAAQTHPYSAENIPQDLQLQLQGDHNRWNAAAALTAAEILGVDRQQAVEALQSFKGVPYRLELIRTIDGIRFVNDTTSTTPIALQTAVAAIQQPMHLIMGGTSKQLPVESLIDTLCTADNIKSIYLLSGSGTDEIIDSLPKSKIKGIFDDLTSAVRCAYKEASTGDTIVLSPGFTSFGMFLNEFDRGDQFNKIVKSL